MSENTDPYQDVRRSEFRTLGDSLEQYNRDSDAFLAGAQNALDRFLYEVDRGVFSAKEKYYLNTIAASILGKTREGHLC